MSLSSTFMRVLVISLTLQLLAVSAHSDSVNPSSLGNHWVDKIRSRRHQHGVETGTEAYGASAGESMGNMVECPHSWTRSQNRCLLLTKWKKIFTEARKLCEMEYNATLPTISNEDENEALRHIAKLDSPFSSPVWLYLLYDHQYRVARWLDKSQSDYVHWDDGQPSDKVSYKVEFTRVSRIQRPTKPTGGAEMECVSFWSDGNWATSVGCSLSLPVVCEKRLTTVAEQDSKPDGFRARQVKRRQRIPVVHDFGHEWDWLPRGWEDAGTRNWMHSASAVTEGPMLCGEDWVESGDKCLLLTEWTRNFTEAQKLCEMEHNATLPTVHSADENQAVRNITGLDLPFSSPIWLYLVYNHQYRVARWLDESQSDYMRWQAGQPSDKSSWNIEYTDKSQIRRQVDSAAGGREMECVSFWSDGNWATKVGCSVSLPVVCEKRLPTVSEPKGTPSRLMSPQVERPVPGFGLEHELESEGSSHESWVKVIHSVSGPTEPTFPMQCRDGWLESKDKCLLLTKRIRNFREARELCATVYNATLPTIHSADENEFLRNNTLAGAVGALVSQIWLNSMHNHKYNATRWLDGSRVDYENWSAGQPSESPPFPFGMIRERYVPQKPHQGEMDCVSFWSDGRWTTELGCSFSLPVICEKRLRASSRPADGGDVSLSSQSERERETHARSDGSWLGLNTMLALLRTHKLDLLYRALMQL